MLWVAMICFRYTDLSRDRFLDIESSMNNRRIIQIQKQSNVIGVYATFLMDWTCTGLKVPSYVAYPEQTYNCIFSVYKEFRRGLVFKNVCL